MNQLVNGFHIKKLLFVLAFCAFVFPGTEVMAWNQATHEQLNQEAVSVFLQNSPSAAKFAESGINTDKKYTGTAIVSASYLDRDCKTSETAKTFRDWVIHGGYSADEPEIQAALRHFYDPLAITGVSYLTDISYYVSDGITDPVTSGIDAKTWALVHPDNPYSYLKALTYYKNSMEIPEGSAKQGMAIPGANVREGGNKTFQDEGAARDFYLAKSFRALGETMHLMADMTQPAHVRNDGHPISEPIEDAMTKNIVAKKAGAKLVTVNLSGNPDQLFHAVAAFTNRYFLSADTIYDPTLKIEPQNGKSYYPDPQISALTKIKGNITFDVIDGIEVPIVEKTLSSYIYGVDERESYTVPSAFTKAQGAVLVPLAVKANEKLVEGFFPTMELSMGFVDALAKVEGMGNQKAYQMKAELQHRVDQDAVWKQYGLTIHYSGTGRIVKVSGKQDSTLATLRFENGLLTGYRTDDGADYKAIAPLLVAGKVPQSDAYLAVNPEDQIYLEVEAGGRIWKTKPVSFEAYQLELLPKHFEGETGDTLTIEGTMNKKPQDLVVRWNFGDGTVESTSGLQQSHVYTKPGSYHIVVEVFDAKNATVPLVTGTGTASIKAKIEEDSTGKKKDESPATPAPKPEQPKPTPAPTQTQPSYDYQAAFAQWVKDYTAEINGRTRHDEYWGCDSTYRIEYLNGPTLVLDGSSPGIYGSHQIWQTSVYFAGEHQGKTVTGTVNSFSTDKPGLYLSLGDLEGKYPQFRK